MRKLGPISRSPVHYSNESLLHKGSMLKLFEIWPEGKHDPAIKFTILN